MIERKYSPQVVNILRTQNLNYRGLGNNNKNHGKSAHVVN